MRVRATIVSASLAAAVLGAALLAAGGCQSPPPTETVRDSADRHFDYGRYESAAADYAEIIARYPGDWQAQHRYGRCMLELKEPGEARRALEIAYTLRPESPDVADALAEAMYREGDHAQLFAFLRERAQSTKSVHAYRRLADYALRVDDIDSAKLAIETAVALDDGRSVEPYLDAAKLAERLDQPDLVVVHLRRAYTVNPHDPRVRDMLKRYNIVPGPSLAMPTKDNRP